MSDQQPAVGPDCGGGESRLVFILALQRLTACPVHDWFSRYQLPRVMNEGLQRLCDGIGRAGPVRTSPWHFLGHLAWQLVRPRWRAGIVNRRRNLRIGIARRNSRRRLSWRARCCRRNLGRIDRGHHIETLRCFPISGRVPLMFHSKSSGSGNGPLASRFLGDKPRQKQVSEHKSRKQPHAR